MSEPKDIDHFRSRISRSANAAEILTIVRAYLWSWDTERIANLQRMDGAWAPFDQQRQPQEILHVLNLYRLAEALRSQCAALDEAGVRKVPELIELEEFCSLAYHAIRQLGTPADDRPKLPMPAAWARSSTAGRVGVEAGLRK